MQKVVLLLLSGLIGLTVSGCASVTAGPDTTEAEAQAAPVKEATEEAGGTAEVNYADFEPEVLYLLLGAEIAGQRGRFDVTLANYVQAAKLSRDEGITERAMRISQSLNADNAQRQLAKLWLEIDPASLEAHRVSAIQALRGNNLETALSHMEQIMDLGGDADFDSLAAMAGNLPPGQQQEMLTLYTRLAERHPDNPEIEYGIALLLKMTGEPNQGLERLNTLLEQHPNFQPAIILKGDLLYQTGRKMSALDYLLKNTRRFPQNRQMGTLYGRMLISEGEMRAAQDEFARLVRQFPDIPGLRLSHALVALENGELALARKELTQLISEGHHTDEAHYYLGRIADDEGKPKLAIGYYEQVEAGSHYFPALARASELRADAGQLDEALASIRRMRETHPEQGESFWLLEINLLMDRDLQQRALDSASQALDQYPDSIRIRYSRAMLLDALNRPADAEQDLRTLLEQDPQNAVALNALGYILTTRTDRLGEARSLIERALSLDPENPAILDSMGWVLYRQGDLSGAIDYLEQAYAAFPDPEVAAHYGEALWVSGQQTQARIIWKEGLAANPEHPLLLETIQRLTGTDDL